MTGAKDRRRGSLRATEPAPSVDARPATHRYSMTKAARALGVRRNALKRLIWEHSNAERDEFIARIAPSVVARKRGSARWIVTIDWDTFVPSRQFPGRVASGLYPRRFGRRDGGSRGIPKSSRRRACPSW